MRLLHYIRERLAPGTTFVLALLLVLPMSPHEASALLLCVEPGGTVNVERSVGDECTSLSTSHAGNETDASKSSISTPDKHCTDCIDVALTLSSASDPCVTAVSVPAMADVSTLRSVMMPDDLGSAFLHIASATPSLLQGRAHSTDAVQRSSASSLLSTRSVILLI